MKEKRYEKVVEWEGFDYERYSLIFVLLTFLVIIGFSFYLGELIPEWNESFFPISLLFIGFTLSLIISFIYSLRRKVYFMEIKE